MPSDFHFTYPHRAWLFLGIFLFLFLFVRLFLLRKKVLKEQFSEEVAEKVVLPTDPLLYWLKASFFCLSWFFACLALMGPKGNAYYALDQGPSQQTASEQDVIFLVDASLSMSIQDAPGDKSRLDYAKEVIEELISHLKGQRVSLYAFTSEPTLLSPLTSNYFFLRASLHGLQINEGGIAGTDILATLENMKAKYLTPSPLREKVFLLFSDGGDRSLETASLLPSFSFKDTPKASLISVGIGSQMPQQIPRVLFKGAPVFSSLQSDFLRFLSSSYFEAYPDSPDKLAKEVSAIFSSQPSHEKKEVLYRSYIKLPLFLSLLALLFYAFMPQTWKKRGIYEI